mmetsp:Transcript_13629/g.30430  ORF Transcript_13629/g.30430 Transcript_13629/m.30430 type:complete len:174 (-) Transcript_13629:404-925(-)
MMIRRTGIITTIDLFFFCFFFGFLFPNSIPRVQNDCLVLCHKTNRIESNRPDPTQIDTQYTTQHNTTQHDTHAKMMKSVLAFLLVAVVALEGTTAFTTGANSRAGIASQTRPVTEMPSYSETSTSLNLKVKVDPNAKTNNAKGNAKAAAYGGSIAIAALLPIAFLVWSAISKP